MRLSRRQVPVLMDLLKRPGHRAYYLCATAPNSPRGKLADGMRSLYAKWYRLIRGCKRRRSPLFPIVGATAVMESPLGRHRDWHPHLNIIVVCSDRLDFKALRQWWHWNIEMRLLDGHQSSIERAFREIIKYACRTVSEKSLAKNDATELGTNWIHRDAVPGATAGDGGRDGHASDEIPAGEGAEFGPGTARAVGGAEREAPNSQTGQAPPMVEWSALEALEYFRAHQRFRRSRTYRELYGIPKPPPVDRGAVQFHGRLSRIAAGGYKLWLSLVESIPGDKSTDENIREGLQKLVRRTFGDPNDVQRAIRARDMARAAFRTIDLSLI